MYVLNLNLPRIVNILISSFRYLLSTLLLENSQLYCNYSNPASTKQLPIIYDNTVAPLCVLATFVSSSFLVNDMASFVATVVSSSQVVGIYVGDSDGLPVEISTTSSQYNRVCSPGKLAVDISLALPPLPLEDARYPGYDDEREDIIAYVSTYDMQGQSIKAN